MRSLSLAFFGLTLFLVWRYMATSAEFARVRASVYLGLFAVNPMLDVLRRGSAHVQHGRLSCGGFHVHVCRCAGGGWYVAVTTAALYTHYFVVLLLMAQAASVLLTETAEERRRRLAQVALPLALLIPWMGYVVAVRQSWESTFLDTAAR